MPDKPVSVEQLLREWPPGYGGVERVAHELASVWGGAVYSLDVQRQAASGRESFDLFALVFQGEDRATIVEGVGELPVRSRGWKVGPQGCSQDQSQGSENGNVAKSELSEAFTVEHA